MFAALRKMGFAGDEIGRWQAPLWPDDEKAEQSTAIWRAFDLSSDLSSRDVLVWCAISCEMAIEPKASVLPYLVDLENGLAAHVYDDRGMDVTAIERKMLVPLYRNRGDWLLHHDRQRIEEVFGRPTGR
jgi:hypothetical protein